MMQASNTVDGRAEYAASEDLLAGEAIAAAKGVAREELGAAAVAFEEARYRRDRALKALRKLSEGMDREKG
jgi:hypothetical protein